MFITLEHMSWGMASDELPDAPADAPICPYCADTFKTVDERDAHLANCPDHPLLASKRGETPDSAMDTVSTPAGQAELEIQRKIARLQAELEAAEHTKQLEERKRHEEIMAQKQALRDAGLARDVQEMGDWRLVTPLMNAIPLACHEQEQDGYDLVTTISRPTGAIVLLFRKSLEKRENESKKRKK